MDQTLAELGQQHRADLSQREMADASAVGQSQPETEAPQFLPMSGSELVQSPATETSESREVPPPVGDAMLSEITVIAAMACWTQDTSQELVDAPMDKRYLEWRST